MSDVSDRIKSRRKAKWRRQDDFAHAAGIPSRTYQDYENGVRDIPSERLLKIARALECELSDLDPHSEIAAAEAKTVGEMAPKELEKMMIRATKGAEQLAEAMETIKRLENQIASEMKIEIIPHRIWAAWNSKRTPETAKQLAELFLTCNTDLLEDMNLSVGGLKAARELLHWLFPPKPHSKA